MRKLISLLLALVMVMGMATVAFANGDAAYTDMSTVTIEKTYTVTNEGTSYPDETFTFSISDKYVVNNGGIGSEKQAIPTVGNVAFVTADGTATKSVTITLPTYTAVGVYEYVINENVGNTAGVVYHEDAIKLVVTVIQDGENKVRIAAVHTETEGEKSNAIENVYNAGSLSVDKTVTGILGDREQYFAITISLDGEDGKNYRGNVITVGQTSYAQNPTEVAVGTPATFYLKHGETINLGNIPYGVRYTVIEADTDYTETITDNGTGTIAAPSQSVNVVNDKTGDVDTGIELDSVPFVIMMVVCGAAAVLFVTKRRSIEF